MGTSKLLVLKKSDKKKKKIVMKNKKSSNPKASEITTTEKAIGGKKLKKEALKTIISDEKIVSKTKKVKLVMPSKYITDNIVESCLNALEQMGACTMKKNVIFEDEQQIFAEIQCIKIQTSKGNVKFVLPHSTAASTGEICLITPDIKKGRKIDHEPTIERWEEILKQANVTSVKTVLPLRQLKVEYDQFELKRRLLTQHDFVMVDTRVLSHASHILGKMFFKKHNMLVPIRLNENEVKKSIDIGLRTSMLRLSEGPTSILLIGHTGMPRNKLKENVLSAIQQLRSKYPGGEANIRSISLKLPLSLSLPIFVTLRTSNSLVKPPKISKNKPKNFRDVEDELSTMPDSKVTVTPGGTVHIKKISATDEQGESAEELEEHKEENSESE